MTIIATAPVRSALRLIDADTVPLNRPARPGRPACPVWCDHTCQNQDVPDGPSMLHGNEVAVITDVVDGDTSKVAVMVSRLDMDGKPGEASVIIETVKGPGDLGPAATAALIDALTHANAIVIADRAQNAGR